MVQPKKRKSDTIRDDGGGKRASRVICLTESFGATMTALGALMHEDPYRFTPPDPIQGPPKKGSMRWLMENPLPFPKAGAKKKSRRKRIIRRWPEWPKTWSENFDEQLVREFSGELFDRTWDRREELLKEIGCGKGLAEEAAKYNMNEALDALHQCEMLYRCLKLTVDKSPRLNPLFEIIDGFREQVAFAYEALHELSQQNDLLVYSDEWTAGGDGPGMGALLTGPLKRAESVKDSNVILYKPLFQTVKGSVLQVSRLLEPLAATLWALPNVRGRPRKYSLGFAILRLVDIFQKFGAGHPRPTVGATSHMSRRTGYQGKKLSYNSAFFRFADGFMRTVDRPPTRPGAGENEFARTVQDLLKVRELDRDLHLLVTRQSVTNDIVRFMQTFDNLKSEAGLL